MLKITKDRGWSMLFYLMHKNDKVALLNVRVGYDAFSITEVKEVYNKKMMPLITYKKRYIIY